MTNWTNHKIKQRIYIKEYIEKGTGRESPSSANDRYDDQRIAQK